MRSAVREINKYNIAEVSCPSPSYVVVPSIAPRTVRPLMKQGGVSTNLLALAYFVRSGSARSSSSSGSGSDNGVRILEG